MGAEDAPILVVDDDRLVRALFRAHLERLGHAVIEASDGERALAEITRREPALVLLDYHMPDLDGPEVTRRIRHGYAAELPIILVTASGAPEHIEAAFAAGADDYITKPVDPRLLRARVGATLQGREDRRRAREAQRLVEELEDARRVQVEQLPDLPITHQGWIVSGAMRPCALVGGDLYAFVVGHGGAATALVIDVSGHGPSAALVASSIAGSLGVMLLTRPVEEAFSALNLQLLSGRSPRYAAIGAVSLGPDSVTITNAGLPPISVLDDRGVVASCEGAGLPPGLWGPSTYESVRVPIRPNHRVVVMSDGLTEAFGSADDTVTPLQHLGLLGARSPSALRGLPERLSSLVSKVGHQDDATLLVLWREP